MSIKFFWCRLYLNKKWYVGYLMALFYLANSKTSQTFFFFHSYLMLQFPTKSAQKIAKRSAKKPVRSTGLHILSKNYAKKKMISAAH